MQPTSYDWADSLGPYILYIDQSPRDNFSSKKYLMCKNGALITRNVLAKVGRQFNHNPIRRSKFFRSYCPEPNSIKASTQDLKLLPVLFIAIRNFAYSLLFIMVSSILNTGSEGKFTE
jgi:hypothetical protein